MATDKISYGLFESVYTDFNIPFWSKTEKGVWRRIIAEKGIPPMLLSEEEVIKMGGKEIVPPYSVFVRKKFEKECSHEGKSLLVYDLFPIEKYDFKDEQIEFLRGEIVSKN